MGESYESGNISLYGERDNGQYIGRNRYGEVERYRNDNEEGQEHITHGQSRRQRMNGMANDKMSQPIKEFNQLWYNKWVTDPYIRKFKLAELLVKLHYMGLVPDMKRKRLSFTINSSGGGVETFIDSSQTRTIGQQDLYGLCVLSFTDDDQLYELSCNFSFDESDQSNYSYISPSTVLNGFYMLERTDNYSKQNLVYYTNYVNNESAPISVIIENQSVTYILDQTDRHKFVVYSYDDFTGDYSPLFPHANLSWPQRQAKLYDIIHEYIPDHKETYDVANNVKTVHEYVNGHWTTIPVGKIYNNTLPRTISQAIENRHLIDINSTHVLSPKNTLYTMADLKTIARDLHLTTDGRYTDLAYRIWNEIRRYDDENFRG